MKTLLVAMVITFMLSGMSGKGYAFSDDLQSMSGGKIDSVSGLQQQILYSILDLHFVEADSMLFLYDAREAFDPEPQYLENYLEFLDALIAGDIVSFQNYLVSSGKRIESIKDLKKDHPASFSALSTIHLQSSVLCAFHNEMFRAAKHLYYSNRYLRQGEDAEAGNTRKFRNRGILILISASVPEEYHWLLKVFGLRGGFEEGMGYLEEYYSFAKGAERLEAYLLFNFAGHTLSSEDFGAEEAGTEDTGWEDTGWKDTGWKDSGPGNPKHFGNRARTLVLYSGALENLSSGKSKAVIDSLRNYHQDSAEREFPYLNLILGEALLNSLDPEADIFLEQFTTKSRSVHYRHYTWHKLSWSWFLQDEWDKYQEARQHVLQSGEPILDADRQALSEAEDSLPLNKYLLEARLLFDGGNYTGALSILEDSNGLSLLNERDSLEFLYRKARTLDKLGESDMAIENYKRVIEKGSDKPWYFAPNAALHLGMIHEGQGDSGKALECYKECLKINKSAYKKSIDYKARQGIQRLDKISAYR